MSEKRFEVVHSEGSSLGNGNRKVIVDKETGVNYIFWQTGNAGGLTPLLGADGKPVVTR